MAEILADWLVAMRLAEHRPYNGEATAYEIATALVEAFDIRFKEPVE